MVKQDIEEHFREKADLYKTVETPNGTLTYWEGNQGMPTLMSTSPLVRQF